MKEILQQFVNRFGFGISVEELVSKAYNAAAATGSDVCILNDRYLVVDGVNYQFRKTRSKGHWTVVEF